jgi:hypothetical protein
MTSYMPYKYFVWWFCIGAGLTSALLLLQQGLGDMVQEARPIWALQPVELLMTGVGGGSLAGCLALACERLRTTTRRHTTGTLNASRTLS